MVWRAQSTATLARAWDANLHSRVHIFSAIQVLCALAERSPMRGTAQWDKRSLLTAKYPTGTAMEILLPSTLLVSVLGLGAFTGPMGPQGATGISRDTGSTGTVDTNGATIVVVPPTN